MTTETLVNETVIDATDAAMASPKARMRTVFRVKVAFDGADDPQVIIEGTSSARACIEAAREWAMNENRNAALRRFGKREATTVIRKRGGEHVEVKIPARDNPTKREKLMAQMLNGGGFNVAMDTCTIIGTFVGYVPAR